MSADASEEAPKVKSRLLDLPPEMRNRIYRYVLVEKHRIIARYDDDQPPDEPGFLRTCRLIRQEAYSIYLKENTFRFKLGSYNATNYVRWRQRSPEHWKLKVGLGVSRAPNKEELWPNFIKYSEAVYRRKVPAGAKSKANNPLVMRVAEQLMAMMLRWRDQNGMSWEEAKENLDMARKLVAFTDPLWDFE